ncbi:hypothetical protein [Nonomuraea sp. NPDC005501]|uniref:hypothetical protein n=1 Tax=Nonomuraea sp. NPDC005501 TaxID=3156884 RepID=UPI0033A91442
MTRLEEVPQPERNQETVQLLNGTRAAAVRACKTPESEYANDVWDLAPFGHRGNLTFTKIGQPWLREAAKRWAHDYLSTVRSRSTNSYVQQHLHGLAILSSRPPWQATGARPSPVPRSKPTCWPPTPATPVSRHSPPTGETPQRSPR